MLQSPDSVLCACFAESDAASESAQSRLSLASVSPHLHQPEHEPDRVIPYNHPSSIPPAAPSPHPLFARPSPLLAARCSPSTRAAVMTAFSTSFGRFGSMRKRESVKKTVQPIDVVAAKQYDHDGPSSASSSSLLTPRPHHYRSTTSSPATSAIWTFAPGSSSTSSSARFVSPPTFVSSSALTSTGVLQNDLEALTPPLSPVHPNSAAAAQATKSPLRRALSRTFFFGSAHATNSAHAQSSAPRISSPIPVVVEATAPHAPRPARPARPVTCPSTGVSPQPNAFGFSASDMTRSHTAGSIVITPPTDATTRRRSRTLMPSTTLTECDRPTPSCSQRSLSSSWSSRFSRPSSPLAATNATDAENRALAPQTPSAPPASPRASLRSIRQKHARKSLHSIFGLSASHTSSTRSESASPHASSRPPPRRRLTRSTSEESFHCRGPGFDAPPAADTRPSVDEGVSRSLDVNPRSSAAVPRSVSLYSCSYPTSMPSSGARRMSDFTIDSYQEAVHASTRAAHDILSEIEAEQEYEYALAGLGLSDPLPAAPRVIPKRLSATSQISLTESIPSSVPSSSMISLSSIEDQLGSASWSSIPSMQNWFSACPPTPPSSIRLQLEFRSLPLPSPALLCSMPNQVEKDDKARPLSGIFISSNSSVLELKETIANRMRESGYRLSPKNLTLTLHLNEDVRANAETALGLKLSVYGKNPAKVLDDSSRLLFEEGAQEEDLVVVDCDPSQILWSI